MAQVEHIEDMQVGDFIQLPRGEWKDNKAAKAKLAEAQAVMSAYKGEGLAPQYQVQYQDKFSSQLQRIR